jgi:hypothetical protein
VGQKKYVRELNELAARYGFGEAELTRGGHLVVQHLTNHRKVFAGSTQMGFREMLNFETTMRRVAQLPPLKPGEPDEAR